MKGVAKHLEVTIASKCSFGKGQGILDAQHAEVEACLQGVGAAEAGLEHEEQNMEATLQQKEQEARERVQALEDRLVQRDFEVQRRMALSVKEVEALVAKEREKAVRGSRNWTSEKRCSTSEIRKVNKLLRRSSSTKKNTKVMEDRRRPRSASPRRLHRGRTRPCRAHFFVGWHPARDVGDAGRIHGKNVQAVAEALKDVQIASRHVTAAEELAARPPPDAAGVVSRRRPRRRPLEAGLEDPPFADEPLASPCPSEAEAPGVVSPVKRLAGGRRFARLRASASAGARRAPAPR